MGDREKGRWHSKSLIQEVKVAVDGVPYAANQQEREDEILIAKSRTKARQTAASLTARQESDVANTIRAALDKPTRDTAKLFELLQVPDFARNKQVLERP